MPLAFVGPTYNLRSRTADVQRTIGMFPVPMEPGNSKSPWVFKDVPGKVVWATLSGAARGARNVNGRLFAVFGATLYEIDSTGAATVRGTLAGAVGFVGMTSNTTQLVVSDSSRLYVLMLADNTFSAFDYPGTGRVDYINQYILFRYRDSQQFGRTSLGDATQIDSLDFASAEGSPDNLVGLIVDHRDVLLFGTDSMEPWLNTGSTEVFERNSGAVVEEGAASEWSIQKLDGSVFWLSQSSRGEGAVNRLQGYQPVRISTQAIEQRLTGLDLSQAYAYVYESEKSSFYVLQVPGLETTLVYDAFSRQWHERAEFVGGQLVPDRGAIHVYAYGKHLLGADDGKLYALDANTYTNDGATLIRDRIMPDSAVPGRERLEYGTFELDCDRGTGGKVQMRYSNDGGATWGAWRTREVGAIGKFEERVKWSRCGKARDRVTQVRCTDAVPFNPVDGGYK